MRLNKDQLLHLCVETRTGQRLGRVVGFVYDTDSQSIVQYEVKSQVIVPGLFEQKLIIGRDEVITITDEKLVVEDSAVTGEHVKNKGLAQNGRPIPLSTRG